MSFALEWRPGAGRTFQSLDIPAQEAVLDVLDGFADEAVALPRRPLPLKVSDAADIDVPGARGTLYFSLEYDPPRRTLVVLSFGYVPARRPPP